LHALVSEFEFRPGAANIIRKTSLVARPYVKEEIEKGGQLPLIVERVGDV
jgi:hypothetical protein